MVHPSGKAPVRVLVVDTSEAGWKNRFQALEGGKANLLPGSPARAPRGGTVLRTVLFISLALLVPLSPLFANIDRHCQCTVHL